MDLFKYRQILRLTQVEIAGRLEMESETYSRIERGEAPVSRPVRFGMRALMCEAVIARFDDIANHYTTERPAGTIIPHVIPTFLVNTSAADLAEMWREFVECRAALTEILEQFDHERDSRNTSES